MNWTTFYFARAEAAPVGKAICQVQLPALFSPATHIQAVDGLEPAVPEARRTTGKLAAGSRLTLARSGGNIHTAPVRPAELSIHEERERDILSDSIARLFPGAGQLLRDQLDKLTIEQLNGVLRTLVNNDLDKSTEEYLAKRDSGNGGKQ